MNRREPTRPFISQKRPLFCCVIIPDRRPREREEFRRGSTLPKDKWRFHWPAFDKTIHFSSADARTGHSSALTHGWSLCFFLLFRREVNPAVVFSSDMQMAKMG